MKRLAMAASLVILASTGVSAQTTEQLNKGATDTSNVLNYGMGYNLQRFSTLNQINKDTVKNLVPVWNYSFADDRSEESQPLVYQGVLYVTTHNATMAVDAKTPFGQTTCGLPPAEPYRAASRASFSSLKKPRQNMQASPGIDRMTWPPMTGGSSPA